MAGTAIVLTATIGAGQPISNMVDCGANFVCGLIMPTAWTTAHVSVLVSLDSTNFYDLFSFYAGESTSLMELKFNVTPNVIVAINPDTMLMARYIRLRSGTRNEPVPQEAARIFKVITVSKVTMEMLSAEIEQ